MKDDWDLCPIIRTAIHRYLPWSFKHNLISYVAEQPIKILKYSEILWGPDSTLKRKINY